MSMCRSKTSLAERVNNRIRYRTHSKLIEISKEISNRRYIEGEIE